MLFALLSTSISGTSLVNQFDGYITAAMNDLIAAGGLSTLVGNASTAVSAIATKNNDIRSALVNSLSVVQNKKEPEASPGFISAWHEFCNNVFAQLTSIENLFKFDSHNNAIFRTHLQSSVSALQAAIAAAKISIRTELATVANYPEFTKYLQDENTTIGQLRLQANTLVLIGQQSTIATPALSTIQHLYLVLTYPAFDITQCTNLLTFAFFDSPSGLTDGQRTQISTLARNTKKLQNLIVMNWGNPDIAANAFLSTSLVQVVINKATTIQTNAFYSCSALLAASFLDATGVGDKAFYYCRALHATSFTAVQTIGSWAFESCKALQIISFLAAKTIHTGAFYNCTALLTAYLPIAKTIGDQVFNTCIKLQTVSYPSNAALGTAVFNACPTTLKHELTTAV